VCSGGSLHTPAILLRSGLRHEKIGRHLTLHPVLGVGGLFDGEGPASELASGVSMGVVVRDYPSDPKAARGYHAVAVQTPPVHLGILGLIMPWMGGLMFKSACLLWPSTGAFIGISRDRSQATNRITIDADGEPVINYTIATADKPMLMEGLVKQLRMMRAAGACILFPIHENFQWLVTDQTPAADAAFEEYILRIRHEGIQPMKMQIFSAHQMSSCRMASDFRAGPVRPSGETWECKNLFVADASVFPTSLGINPMITTVAFGHYISRNILKHLGIKPFDASF
jgi:choline dehydrogenase-like flavoprotein